MLAQSFGASEVHDSLRREERQSQSLQSALLELVGVQADELQHVGRVSYLVGLRKLQLQLLLLVHDLLVVVVGVVGLQHVQSVLPLARQRHAILLRHVNVGQLAIAHS